MRITNAGIVASPVFITTHIDDKRQYVIQKLDNDFIQKLRDENKTTQANYYAARKKIMEQITGTTTWR